MNITHLEQAIRVLKNIPAHSFDLSTWLDDHSDEGYNPDDTVYQAQEGYKKWKEKDQESEKHRCGTVACAMGWMCFDPYFNQQGLSFEPFEGLPIFNQEHRGFSAAKNLFGFQNASTTACLFSDTNYPTEHVTTDQVIARIEYLIEHGEWQFSQACIRGRV